jgi:microcompartment protein CcmL/EutN
VASGASPHPSYRDLGSARTPALGFLELSSISRGLFLTDVVLKKAPVRVIASQPVSSGKHVLLYMGDNASVDESHRAALEDADGTILKQILIPGVHEELAPFLDSLWTSDPMRMPAGEAVGIAESSTLAGALIAADQALKSARVHLCRMRLGQGIGGKAYFVISGRQEEVEAGLEAARLQLAHLESFHRIDVIPRPQDEALAYF